MAQLVPGRPELDTICFRFDCALLGRPYSDQVAAIYEWTREDINRAPSYVFIPRAAVGILRRRRQGRCLLNSLTPATKWHIPLQALTPHAHVAYARDQGSVVKGGSKGR